MLNKIRLVPLKCMSVKCKIRLNARDDSVPIFTQRNKGNFTLLMSTSAKHRIRLSAHNSLARFTVKQCNFFWLSAQHLYSRHATPNSSVHMAWKASYYVHLHWWMLLSTQHGRLNFVCLVMLLCLLYSNMNVDHLHPGLNCIHKWKVPASSLLFVCTG